MTLSAGRLRSALAGPVFTAGDAGYDQARRVHNGLIDRRPLLVAQPAGVADVQAAVRLAAAAGLAICVRGGGHSVAGHGTCDGGLVIDLSAMREVAVDPRRRIVRVGGGALLGDLDAATQAHQLAVPTGQVSSTGVGGLTLSGGMGALQRRYGLTCDNLLAADVVTASGQVVRAGAGGDPELLWALQGGGGNFGVVTAFEFQAHPVGPTVVAGLIAHPAGDAAEVLAFHRDVMEVLAEETSLDAVFMRLPPIEVFPEERWGEPVVGLFLRHCGEVDDGLAAAEVVRRFGRPVADFVAPMAFLDMQRLLDPLNPRGLLNYWTGEFLACLDSRAIDLIASYGCAIPASHSVIQVIPFDAAPTRVDPDATAFTHRAKSWLVHVLGQWGGPEETAEATAWVKAMGRDLRRLGTGDVYLNLVTDDEAGERVRTQWAGGRMGRLQRVKAECDPDNLFRFNHNIEPAPAHKIGQLAERAAN